MINQEKKTLENNLNKWDDWYKNLDDKPSEFHYGNTLTYLKSAEFLEDCNEIEDWGVGAGGFLRFRPDAIGVDGSNTVFAKKPNTDLKIYKSNCECINMRHVLEHNYLWEEILKNILSSATRKITLVTFVPFSDNETKELAHNQKHGVDVPDLSLDRKKFFEIINSFNPKSVISEKFETETGYGQEEIFYITL
jgi:hypothetical protein